MDTRSGQGFTGAFGPPALAAYGNARQVPIPTSGCNIPATAGAYSLNITALPVGTLEFLSVWPAGQPYPNVSTLNATSGGAVANAAIVVAGTNGAIQILASDPTNVIIDINGYYAVPTDAYGNTALGLDALQNDFPIPNQNGFDNTAIGLQCVDEQHRWFAKYGDWLREYVEQHQRQQEYQRRLQCSGCEHDRHTKYSDWRSSARVQFSGAR